MGFQGLQIPDSSWILNPNSRIQSLPGAAMDGLEDAARMKDIFAQYKLRDYEIKKADRGAAVQAATDELMKKNPRTPAGQRNVAAGLNAQGFGEEGVTKEAWAQKWDQDLKSFREADKEAIKKRGAASARVIKKLPPEDRPKAWELMKKELAEDGYDISDMPPQPTDEVLTAMERATLSQKEIEDQAHKDAELKELSRWHDIQATMGKNTTPPSGGLTTAWTDQGLVIVDKPNATVTPAVTKGGTPAQPKEPVVPVAVNNKVIANMDTMTKITQARSALKQNPKATGLVKGIAGAHPIGSAIVNHLDPKGVNARADVADVGSAQIYDRSGAAVTISEAPRFMPFIPLPTDSKDVADKKLDRLFKLIEEETRLYKLAYPKAVGGTGAGGATGSWSGDPMDEPAGAPPPPPEQDKYIDPPKKIWSRTKK